MAFSVGKAAELSLGVRAQYTATRENDETVVGITKPYGSGRFGEVGATAELTLDRRDVVNAPSKGATLELGASAFPAVWSLDRPYGEVHGTATTYARAQLPLEPTLALRVGGQHVWGRFPFHDAAFLGGASTLRGWDQQRFAGRSSLFGSAELRIFALKSFVLVPADVGLLGFVDAGRVYADGDDGDGGPWHTGIGGGIWFAPLTRANTVSLQVAWGKERSGVYLRSGFAF
jgi:outer membrane protein assembly factor BamA